MARVLTCVVCASVGIAGIVKPGIVVWTAGAENSYPCHSDLLGYFLGAYFCD
jgi:hypothetical protein